MVRRKGSEETRERERLESERETTGRDNRVKCM
jgi:hypothetical protein